KTDEPQAGDTPLTLSRAVPSSWTVGSKLVLPDTRQQKASVYYDGSVETETVTISAVSGSTITLTAPLAYSHLGGHAVDTSTGDRGALKTVPAVALLDRNVVIQSQNANGTRRPTLS